MSSRPPLIDPRAVPVTAVDDHLPPVPAHRLLASSVRERFRSGAGYQPELPGDGAAVQSALSVRASVLVPLVMRPGGLQVLLTRRTDHLRDHAGQISFPGGRAEAHDRDAVDTALREAAEEVGLARDRVEVIGSLPDYITVTHFIVTPVVALVSADHTLQVDPFEVAEAFEVPLPFLMTPAHHRRHLTEFQGRPRQFLSMPWQAQAADGTLREYFIWGATAAMLRNLYGFLNG